MEWQKKQDALKKGQVPVEYQEYLGPKQKKFTSKSTFLNDKSLYDEYQNRQRYQEEPCYTQVKKVNHQKMSKELEEKEKKFLRVLEHDEQKQQKKPQVKPQERKRPITSTKPSKAIKKSVPGNFRENESENCQVFRTYNDYDNKQYKFNSDLDL